MTADQTANTPTPYRPVDARLYCNDPACPNFRNFPYGQPDEHVTEHCFCEICKQHGQRKMSTAARHLHGIFEHHRRNGFRYVTCAVAGCSVASFAHQRSLAESAKPWLCGMHAWMNLAAGPIRRHRQNTARRVII